MNSTDEKLKQRKLAVPDDTSTNKNKSHRSPHHRPLSPPPFLSSSLLPPSPIHHLPSTPITSTCSATSPNHEQNISSTITTTSNSDQTNKLLLDFQPRTTENQLSPIAPSLNYVPVTPMIVGKVMSRDDVYYAPHPGNPFPVRLRTNKLVESFKREDANIEGVLEGTNQRTKPSTKLNRDAFFKPPNSILVDCSAYLELHPPPSVPRRESPRNIFFPSILCPPLFSSNMASLSALFNKSLKSPTYPVRLFRSNSLPATPTTFLANISDESRTRSIYEMSPVTPEEENVLGGKMGACGLASYIKTTIPSCCSRFSNRASYRKPTCFYTSTNALTSPSRQLSIVDQPKTSLSHRIKSIIDSTYISTSSSVDSALGKEEVSAAMVRKKFRSLKKNNTFHAFSRPGHHALHKTKNIYTDDEDEEDYDDGDYKNKTKIKFKFLGSPSFKIKKIFNERKNVKDYKNAATNQSQTDTKPVLAVKNCHENSVGAFQRLNFRTSSAVVCRSASAIYHHHPFTEQGILSWYFEEWIRKASKHRRTCMVDEDGVRSKNEECSFELNDKSSVGDEDSDDDSLEENKTCKSDDDDYDDDYFSSSLCNHQVNNSGCSHGSFYSLDDNLYPSSSSCAENSTTGSWAPDVDLGRDDPKRKSKEKFLELVKNWEDRSEETKRKVCENELCSFHNHTNIHEVSKGKHCSLHFPLSNPYLKPMEFAEFYLYRRFQELKQKWEQNQQC